MPHAKGCDTCLRLGHSMKGSHSWTFYLGDRCRSNCRKELLDGGCTPLSQQSGGGGVRPISVCASCNCSLSTRKPLGSPW